MDRRKVRLVLWREYLENVRTKTFLFGLVLTPVLMGLVFLVPLFFPQEDRRIALLDGTGQLRPFIAAHLEARNAREPRTRILLVDHPELDEAQLAGDALAAAEERLRRAIATAEPVGGAPLSGAVVIEQAFLLDDQAVADGTAVRYLTPAVTDQAVPNELRALLAALRRPIRTQALLERELERRPLAFLEMPLERVELPAPPDGARPPFPHRLHVCDGSGLVRPALHAALQQLAAGEAAAPGGAGQGPLPGGMRLPAGLAQLTPWRMDGWTPPPIEGARSPARVALLQLGLDPDAFPVAALEAAAASADPLAGAAAPEADETPPPHPRAALEPLPLAEAQRRFEARVEAGALEAFLLVRRELLARASGPEPGDAVLYVREGLDPAAVALLEPLLQAVLWAQRFQAEILAANVTPSITTFNPETGAAYETGDMAARVIVPIVFVLLLFYGVFGIAQALLNGVIEEKSNRIVEVLLSSVTPLELMLGKILGIGLVGFTLIAVWVAGGYTTAVYKLGPEFVALHLRPELLGYFALYYVLGFLLLASMIAAAGAVCNTIKEAQNFLAAITVLYIVPVLTLIPIMEQPDGVMARVLSFVPPLTPFVMMNRLAVSRTVPAIEIVATAVLLALSVAVAIWLAARVFRVGILMYGKPPRLRELLRWIRYA